MAKEPKASPTRTRKRPAVPKRPPVKAEPSAPKVPTEAATGRERRRAPRLKVNLQASWEGDLGIQRAHVTSLSKLGCFVLSGGQVRQKELIRLEMVLDEEAAVCMWGEVVEAAEEIGFAMQFTSTEEADQVLLDQFLQLYLTSAT